MDGLVDASKEPFVYCYECPVPFWGSPADIVHHLMQACDDHYWPLAKNIKYATCYPFTVPESLEDHHRLLVSEEDGSVFLLDRGHRRGPRRPPPRLCSVRQGRWRWHWHEADVRVRAHYYYPSEVRGRRHWLRQADLDSAELGPSRRCGQWKTHGIIWPPTMCTGTPRRFTWTSALSS